MDILKLRKQRFIGTILLGLEDFNKETQLEILHKVISEFTIENGDVLIDSLQKDKDNGKELDYANT